MDNGKILKIKEAVFLFKVNGKTMNIYYTIIIKESNLF